MISDKVPAKHGERGLNRMAEVFGSSYGETQPEASTKKTRDKCAEET